MVIRKITIGALLNLTISPIIFAGTIVGSKHDLGSGNFYGNFAGTADTSEICVFCHTPHNANNLGEVYGAPLWNRRLTDTGSYLMYTSPTMDASCLATPSGVSLACLSCHDVAGGGAVNPTAGGGDQHDLVNPPNYLLNNLANNAGGAVCNACHGDDDRNGGGPNNLLKLYEEWQIGNDLTDDHPISILGEFSNTTQMTIQIAGRNCPITGKLDFWWLA